MKAVARTNPTKAIDSMAWVPMNEPKTIKTFECDTQILYDIVISWWSDLLVEETWVSEENPQHATSHWQTLSHNVVSSTPRHEVFFILQSLLQMHRYRFHVNISRKKKNFSSIEMVLCFLLSRFVNNKIFKICCKLWRIEELRVYKVFLVLFI